MQLERYSRPAIALHWTIGAVIIFNVLLAWLWPFLPDEQVRPAINWHKTLGILVLGLVAMRIIWRFVRTPPPMPTTFQKWESRLAHVTHILLYVVMIGLPLSGWIMDSAWDKAADHPILAFNGAFELPRIGWIMAMSAEQKKVLHDVFGEGHEIGAKLLYLLFVLHVAGALKHQWIDKQPELQRMWFGKKRA